MSDLIFELATSNSKDVIAAKTIFVKGHEFAEFQKKYDNYLDDKIIFIGNSDQNFHSDFPFSLRPKHIYVQNSEVTNAEAISTLPIGLENLRLARAGFKFLHLPPGRPKLEHKVLLPPMSPTNDVRRRVLSEASDRSEIFQVENKYRNTLGYFKLTKKYLFVFVCEGNGFDTHRLWEVLYQDSFPVVLRTNWTQSLSYLNLPILEVESIQEVTSELLHEFKMRNIGFSARTHDKLWSKYWRNLVKSCYDQE